MTYIIVAAIVAAVILLALYGRELNQSDLDDQLRTQLSQNPNVCGAGTVQSRGQPSISLKTGNDLLKVKREAISEARLDARKLAPPCGEPGGTADTSAYSATFLKSSCETLGQNCRADLSSISCKPITRYSNVKPDDCDISETVTRTSTGSWYSVTALCYNICNCSLTCTKQDDPPGAQENQFPNDL